MQYTFPFGLKEITNKYANMELAAVDAKFVRCVVTL